jgi:hypothetical protein
MCAYIGGIFLASAVISMGFYDYLAYDLVDCAAGPVMRGKI